MAEFTFVTHRVQRAKKQALLDFILDGLKLSGCTILYASDASNAPFFISFSTRAGERQGVLVYAFFANSEKTRNRPVDEHRFQVKYGSDAQASLVVAREPSGLCTTLFVGIDPDRGFLVGANPALYDGTPMFISVEFKRHHAEEIATRGWAAWERRSGRNEHQSVEVLVGATQRNLLKFIQFERLAVDLDPGNRQLVAEKVFGTPSIEGKHALIEELGLHESALLDLIHGAPRLKMAVRGWVAEAHLETYLSRQPDVSECHRIEHEGSPDVSLRYRGSRPILVECKNVLRVPASDGRPRIDFQRTRAAKGDPCSRYYRADDFAVLAACLHAVTEKWEFRFVATRVLEAHPTCKGRLASNLRVGGGAWQRNFRDVLATMARQ